MKLTTVLLSMLLFSAASAQEVIATQGDSYTNAYGSLDFTIGELLIATASDGSATLTQGFHQSKWDVVGIKDYNSYFEAAVFPNPIASMLNIQTTSFRNTNYALYDFQGRLVTEGRLDGEQTAIPVSEFAQGVYSLVLNNGSQVLKTFKLIKSN